MIAEEGEWGRRRPFLTHERERRRREKEQQHDRGEQRVVPRVVRQARPERAIADLIVILNAIHELGWLERERVAAARGAGPRRHLSFVEPSALDEPREVLDTWRERGE